MNTYYEPLIECEEDNQLDGKEFCQRPTSLKLFFCQTIKEQQTIQSDTIETLSGLCWTETLIVPDADEIDRFQVNVGIVRAESLRWAEHIQSLANDTYNGYCF